MKKNKLILALIIASTSSIVLPTSNVQAANITDVEGQETKEVVEKNIADIPKDDEVTYPKNEKDTRESDGTNKFNRATETERETFGEDKNVVNIDKNVKAKLDETKGEYGKKNGEYANNKLKAIDTPVKNVVINPGENENKVAVTWFGKSEVRDSSRLYFNGKEYKPERARKTGDSNGYSTYTVLLDIKPGENYEYYIRNDNYKTEKKTLKTKALGNDNEFSMVLIGDPQIGSGDSVWDSKGLNKNTQAKVDQDKIDFAKTIEIARKLDPHFFLSMGDNVEIAGYEGEYDYFFDNDLFREKIFSSVVGNHETYIDKNDTSLQNTVFSDHFYLPNESELGSISYENEDGTRTYIPGDYWYSYGDTLFLNINSNERDSNIHSKFIEKAIKNAEEKRGLNFSWKVVSFHHAPYSTATHTSDDDILQRRSELVKIFNNNNIDLVLNGHDHIYVRSGHMLAGEQALDFEKAYGTHKNDPNAGIKDNFTKTYNNYIYDNGKVVVDGISLDYGSNEVTDPRGTLFLTMSASAGAKFYNPIGEDQWFVQRSLDDRSQLFSKLTFSKNQFRLLTMDTDGNIVDSYTINKTDEHIKNPNNKEKTNFSKLEAYIRKIQGKKLLLDKENIRAYNYAIENAIKVLNDKNASQEEVDSAIEVLNTRLSGVEFLREDNKNTDNKDSKVDKNVKDSKDKYCQKDKEVSIKKEIKAQKTKVENFKKDSDFENKNFIKSSNVKTGVTSLSSILGLISISILGLSKSKRK
ncbi:metallophosphoesterase [Anaerococcus porci]|uniref:metallophosphoesterase n=1 Tax=Anaerococcus porci TaxID=2652269 RepID=UPI002A753C8D|nr:metallophosphoesterase [Anaerococcus porci]MDY3005429.1 metallophosphoesterase [Anaerococcus porci]